jgi:hypothetical protein
MHGLHGAKTVGTLFRTTTVGKLLYPTKRTPFVEGGLAFRPNDVWFDECAIRSIVSPVKSVHTTAFMVAPHSDPW